MAAPILHEDGQWHCPHCATILQSMALVALGLDSTLFCHPCGVVFVRLTRPADRIVIESPPPEIIPGETPGGNR